VQPNSLAPSSRSMSCRCTPPCHTSGPRPARVAPQAAVNKVHARVGAPVAAVPAALVSVVADDSVVTVAVAELRRRRDVCGAFGRSLLWCSCGMAVATVATRRSSSSTDDRLDRVLLFCSVSHHLFVCLDQVDYQWYRESFDPARTIAHAINTKMLGATCVCTY
jgi:hypothetical protein